MLHGGYDDDGWEPTGDFIAFTDGEMTSHGDAADITISRIGGRPSLLSSVESDPNAGEANGSVHSGNYLAEQLQPRCAACTHLLFLVAQLYAPTDDDAERVLYVWGCNRQRCMTREGSWRAVRGVRSGSGVASQLRSAAKMSAGAAGQAEDVVLDDEQDVPLPVVHTASDFEFKVEDSWDDATSRTASADATTGFFSGFSDTPTPSDAALFAVPTENFQFHLTPKASVSKPAKAPKSAPAVSAQMKSQTLSKLPASLPTELVEDVLSVLTLDDAASSVNSAFPAMYLNIEEEYVRSKQAKSAAYAHYQIDDGTLDLDCGNSGRGSRKGNVSAEISCWDARAEGYEATAVRGYTKLLAKFVDRCEDNPGHVVRYNLGGQPLHYSDRIMCHIPGDRANKSDASSRKGRSRGALDQGINIPHCQHCGARRIYECQLMPTILSVLPVEDLVPDKAESTVNAAHPSAWHRGMEFGTVQVYVCEKNCVPENSGPGGTSAVTAYIPEVCVVQLESE